MSLIYHPKGKAGEYSPLALNTYTSCDHRCRYCYCERMVGQSRWYQSPEPRNLKGLASEAARARRQVLLSFMGDPYCAAERQYRATRYALGILAEARCSVSILTKGGERCLDDLALFRSWPDHRVAVGATLTGGHEHSRKWEPWAPSPNERIVALKTLHERGIETWASFEPVLDCDETLEIASAAMPFINSLRVGAPSGGYQTHGNIRKMLLQLLAMARFRGVRVYVKESFWGHVSDDLRPEERDPANVWLPDRPARFESEQQEMFTIQGVKIKYDDPENPSK